MKYEIKCGFCGENFESSRANTQYCSVNCRVKSNQFKKKQEEVIGQGKSAQQEEYNNQRIGLEQQVAKLIRHNKYLTGKEKEAQKRKRHCSKVIHKIRVVIKYTELDIKNYEGVQKRLWEDLQLKRKEETQLKTEVDRKVNGIARLTSMLEIKKIEKVISPIEDEIEELYQDISLKKRKLIRLNADLEEWKERLNVLENNLAKFRDIHKNNQREIDGRTNRLSSTKATQSITPLPKPGIPKRIITKTESSGNSIGAGDLQHINFQTFQLSGELGAFLGELDRNKTCFALTGDSGAGKSWFSFEIVRLFIAELRFRVKYFSLEEGLGKLTQEKVAAFGLGNELNLVGKGSLEDVRVAAKEYPMVVADSFNSLNAKAEEFERLRTDFPNTLFLLIFQKTTAGTMRGGSAIKYNSSATINVVKRNGQRIAIMEKGRYGTIGWEYSITEGQVIKTDDSY